MMINFSENQSFKKILLIDNSQKLLTSTTNILESYGLNVLTAPNGANALKIFIKHQKNINLLITGIALSDEMNGIQLAARILSIQSNLPILFTKDSNEKEIDDCIHIKDEFEIIEKPYDNYQFISKIQSILMHNSPIIQRKR